MDRVHDADRLDEEFGSELGRPGGPRLDHLALWIAAAGDPPLDLDGQLDRLDALAGDFGGGTASELMGWMGIRGFRGNAASYYDPENSYLHRVIDRGLGIPISLSVLAIEIGRRSGIELVGIGLPGEFVVAERDHPDRFHNPFRQRSMTPEEVTALIRRFAGPEATLTPALRTPVGPTAIATRMLANLAQIFGHADQPAELVWVLRFQRRLPGADGAVDRRLVAALARLGRTWEAVEVLEQRLRLDEASGRDDDRAADEVMLLRLRAGLN